MEKRQFFWTAMAGLGKYHTGGYGLIGVYRVNPLDPTDPPPPPPPHTQYALFTPRISQDRLNHVVLRIV